MRPANGLLMPVLGLGWLLGVAVSDVSAQATQHDRIVRSTDVSVAQVPGGTGWTISARGWLASQTPGPLDLGSVLTLWVNGIAVGSASQSMIVPADGGGSCIASCAAQAGCVACIPSPVPPLACFCCSRFIDAT